MPQTDTERLADIAALHRKRMAELHEWDIDATPDQNTISELLAQIAARDAEIERLRAGPKESPCPVCGTGNMRCGH